MLYRALKRLEVKNGEIAQGAVFGHERLNEKTRAILEERNIIAPVSAPLLSDVPGWKIYATKLGVAMRADEFIEEQDTEKLSKTLAVDSGQVERLKQNLIGWLTIPQKGG